MTKAATAQHCDGFAGASEGQAAPDAILFREPRNHARRCRAYVFHAALASLPWRVAGEGGAYDLPPPVFIEPVNPAHAVHHSRVVVVSMSVAGMEIDTGGFCGNVGPHQIESGSP